MTVSYRPEPSISWWRHSRCAGSPACTATLSLATTRMLFA